ncbi:peptidase [Priestia flexa]|uniref:peptidase n=1 Tax=Priestia flexa TaxID=86664 RepID=UPI000C2460F5|nr:peptidase [Priestia flexa]MEC0666052.1 peptidase [Priestia flexa]MED3822755.1 peptidase [Priestia flexa]
MTNWQGEIQSWLTEHKYEIVRLLQRFVQEASVQRDEKYVQAIVIEKLRQLQLTIDIWEPDIKELRKNEAFVSTRTNFQDSPNVVGTLKGRGGGKSILLNGHIDVVPAGDLAHWRDEPYSGMVRDGNVYGRGSTDMKGGNVALLFAIQALQELGILLKGDVIFQSVIEEESGGAGTLACVLRGYKADGAIIPEPTSMKIFSKQQGSMWFRLTIHGRSAHGGTRYEGVSAIEKAMLLIEHLQQLEKNRNARIVDPLYKNTPIPVPINIGTIKGGSWPSSVADEVIIEGRIGVAPHEKMKDVKEEVEEWLKKISVQDSWFDFHPVDLEWFGAHWLPNELDTQHPLISSLSQSYERAMGDPPTIEASPWGTDGGILSQVGKIPTVVFGPGVTEVAHFPNEYISIESVIKATEIIALTIIDWCEIAD